MDHQSHGAQGHDQGGPHIGGGGNQAALENLKADVGKRRATEKNAAPRERGERTEDPMPHTNADILVELDPNRTVSDETIAEALRARVALAPGTQVLFTTPLQMRIDTFKALGAIPTPMASTEVYMAAKQGVLDGAEWGPLGIIEQKSYETAKYYTLTKHFNMPGSVGMSAKWFNALKPEYQKAILESADEARAWFDQEFDADEAKALAEVKQRGMEVIETPNMEPFRVAVKPVYDRYADKVGGWQMIQAVLDTK